MAEQTSPVNNNVLIQTTGQDPVNEAGLTSELRRMRRRPFGVGVDGQPIAESNGKIITTAIRYMQDVVGERAAQTAPSDATPEQVAALVSQAQSDALDRLVTMLNEAIPEERYC